MKNEKPILFSGEMVQAIFDGRKTQTRRVVKPQPPCDCVYEINGAYSHALCHHKDNPSHWVPPTPKSTDHRLPCPYGAPGKKLWVKETWRTVRALSDCKPSKLQAGAPIEYAAGGFNFNTTVMHDAGQWRPSIFMCEWMSRITLEITAVRVERLQDIDESDAADEGVGIWMPDHKYLDGNPDQYRRLYRILWESINGAGSWDANPWVWVIEFKKI